MSTLMKWLIAACAGPIHQAADAIKDKLHAEQERAKKDRLYERAMRNHRPGTTHTVAGTEYLVGKNGSWRRQTPRKCEVSKNHFNNSVYRRHKAVILGVK